MKHKQLFDEISFVYSKDLRKQFKAGTLPRKWMAMYPQLFTQQDLDLTRKGSSYIFFEWLAAILFYEATGYLSFHKWDCKVHKEKNSLFRSLCPSALVKTIGSRSGCPDLLTVSPDKKSDWFFCEVKGPGDRIGSEQKKIARKILKETGRKVMLLHFIPIN